MLMQKILNLMKMRFIKLIQMKEYKSTRSGRRHPKRVESIELHIYYKYHI